MHKAVLSQSKHISKPFKFETSVKQMVISYNLIKFIFPIHKGLHYNYFLTWYNCYGGVRLYDTSLFYTCNVFMYIFVYGIYLTQTLLVKYLPGV